jgi:NADPH:quinone reductase-like Zn-dependent oxidoreductase
MFQQKSLFLSTCQGEWSICPREIDKPGSDEILVRIEATGLNPLDWKINQWGVFAEKWPAVLGFEGAGIVLETGDNVQGFSSEDRV